MKLFKNNKKSVYVVEERSRDDVPFQIPNLYFEVRDSEKQNDVAVSSIYGKDELIDEMIAIRNNDIDPSIYDAFRETPRIKDENDPYYEFRKIPQKKKEVVSTNINEEKVEVENNTKETENEASSFVDSSNTHNDVQEEIVDEVKEEPKLFVYNELDKEDTLKQDNTFNEEMFGSKHVQTEEIKIEKPVIEDKPISVDNTPKVKINFEKPYTPTHIEDKREEELTKPQEVKKEVRQFVKYDGPMSSDWSVEELAIINSGHKSPSFKDFKKPPLSILQDPKFFSNNDNSWIEDNINRINQNLKAFKIDGQVLEHTSGPTFTRYSIMLGPGVSGSKIESIQNDLQRTLEAQSIRIENPIPGKPYVGIEVPNKVRRGVNLKELLDREEFLNSDDPTLVPVGLDVEGNCKFISIQSLPHGLVAGSSGSGKSVFLNTIVTSLIYKNTPDDVRFFFIDPKKVDLQAYAKIPHLLSPIVDDVKDGINSMKWLIEEMERRFALFRILKVSNLKGYRKAIIDKPEFRPVPYIIAIIDEAGDFLMNGGNEAMELVTKLIQKCRAAGMHLFISTQKPVAKIMSTTIKSNASGRFALRVTSSMDSMVILDSGGAEKLLGNGDMIFSQNGITGRFQSAYVSDEEIASITTFVEKQCPQDFYFNPVELNKKEKATPGTVSDDLFPDVARYVVENQRCSINQITQDFQIGYNRAQEIVKTLEYYNIVEQNQGTKARQILVDELALEEILMRIGV